MRRQSFRGLTALSVVVTLHLCIGLTTARTIDEIIASAYSHASSLDILSDSAGGAVLHELDMMLTPEQNAAIYGEQSEMKSTNSGTDLRQKRKAAADLLMRWTNKQIPYRLQSADFSSSDITEINKAIADWSTYTCISFRPATSSDSNFINFQNGAGCSSFIGMTGGEQPLTLAKPCRRKGNIIHELGHAVGFVHEQNRPDRDDYIIVKTENLKHENDLYNFVKQPLSVVSTLDVPYDYKSVMHYSGRAFSGNGQYTIVTKDPAFQTVIGSRFGLSFNDIKLANLMYKCNEQCGSSTACPKEGFLGKDCKCWCPGNPVLECYPPTEQPLKKATSVPAVPTTPALTTQLPKPSPTCIGNCQVCWYWRIQRYCPYTDTPFMSKACHETCCNCPAMKTP